MTERHLPVEASAVTRGRPRSGRVLLTAAVLVNAAVLVVGTTVASFTGREAVQQVNASGTVDIEFEAGDEAVVAAVGPALAAGDWFERAVTVKPAAGTIEIGSWTLSAREATTPPPSPSLASALTLKVESCSVRWASSTVAQAVVHSCSGTRAPVLSERAITMTDVPLPGLAGGGHHLLLTVKLADSAPDTLQGRSSSIEYTFGGVQRPGKAR